VEHFHEAEKDQEPPNDEENNANTSNDNIYNYHNARLQCGLLVLCVCHRLSPPWGPRAIVGPLQKLICNSTLFPHLTGYIILQSPHPHVTTPPVIFAFITCLQEKHQSTSFHKFNF
jgi:hypothetical protein